MDNALTFSIYPDGETVSLALFNKTLRHIQRLVMDVDYAVSREKGVRRWVIEELHSSVPTVSIRPLLPDPMMIETIRRGISIITQGTLEPPDHFDEGSLDDLKRMAGLFRGRDRARHLEISSNGFEKTLVREDIGEKVDRILQGGDWNLGSLEGTLDAVNLHGNPTFTIWARISKAPVRCYFPQDKGWKEKVKSLLEKPVLVSGRVHYFRNGLPRSITHIDDVLDRTRDNTLPRATFGSIPYKEGRQESYLVLRKSREK